MEILGVPAWFFAAVAIVSLFLGVGIRQYLDRRKVHEERVHREEVKALKKRLKYEKKHAKKPKAPKVKESG